MPTIAEMLITSLADLGVRSVWGVVGDALNPITDAIRREDRIEWIGVRHEEVAAFAAGAQAQLTGTLGVCMGTVGPGSIHLLNGLYDAKKSHAPVLAVCGQVPTEEIGSDFFQEVDNDRLFSDVALFNRTITAASQATTLVEQAVQSAINGPGVSVLTVPGDIGELDLPKGAKAPHFVTAAQPVTPAPADLAEAARLLNGTDRVTLLVGAGARPYRDQVLELASRLQAPMVLSLKAKEGLEKDNEFEVGQSGLIGNPATTHAFNSCDVLFLVGTDFPYRDWYPTGKTVIQLDRRAEHIGRRVAVDLGLVGDVGSGLGELLPQVTSKTSAEHLQASRKIYETWQHRQQSLTDPDHDRGVLGKIRSLATNPDDRIRPELLAQAINTHAADDAIFTTDTGMATVWLSRFVRMTGGRQLLGSFNLGSMANAMPQALGVQAIDRSRQVIAFCGDGGLSMLLGDLMTSVGYGLPVKLIVFNNGRLGMVKLEQEQVGLPEFGTVLRNPDFAAVAGAIGLHSRRVERPEEVESAVAAILAHPGPALLDVVTSPDEIAIPGKVKLDQGWGFAIAKVRETLLSEGDH
jgi:pyruvate dehydrogenase (quinone)